MKHAINFFKIGFWNQFSVRFPLGKKLLKNLLVEAESSFRVVETVTEHLLCAGFGASCFS